VKITREVTKSEERGE